MKLFASATVAPFEVTWIEPEANYEMQCQTKKNLIKATNMDEANKFTRLLVYYNEFREIMNKDNINLNAVEVKLKQIKAIETESRLCRQFHGEDEAELTPELFYLSKKCK